MDEARASVAAILTADLADVSLAHGHDDAYARALRAVELHPGDRIVVVEDPETEAAANVVPSGVTLDIVTAEEVVDAAPDGAFRALVLPLVSALTGARLPVEAVAASARAAGAQTVVDASLAVGAVPVRPADLGVDVLVARGDAWLLGPQGLGVVVRRGSDTSLSATAEGFHLPSIVGLARGCGWLSMYVGLPWVHERGRALTEHAVERLASVAGLEMLTPERRATTLAFRIAGWSAAEALDELGARIFLLASTVPSLDALRIGIGFWNTESELDRLADAIALLAAHTPETLPRRAILTVLGR